MAKPTHKATIAREYEAADGTKKTAWTDIGVGWAIKEGQGVRVRLEAYPVGGELLILPIEAKADGGSDNQ